MTDAANGGHRKSDSDSLSDETIVMPAGRPSQPAAPRPQAPSEAIRRNRKIALISICCVAAVLVLSIIIGVSVYFVRTADNGLILDNVYAAGINLGGMTPEEAAAALHKAARDYGEKDLLIRLPDDSLTLSPVDTDAALNVEELVRQAFQYGREGSRSQRVKAAAAAKLSRHTMDLLPYLNLNTDYIKQALEDLYNKHHSTLSQPQITLEGDRPEDQPDPELLEDPEFDPTEEIFQTLTIVLGTADRTFDGKKLYNQVLDAFNHNDFTPIEVSYQLTAPEAVDLDDLAKEHCTEPVDAKLNEKDYSVTPEIYGYGFDRKSAGEQLKNTPEGGQIVLELGYLAPKVTKKSLESEMFQDVLAEYDSVYYLNPPRTNNLQLACAAIDGYILRPGEAFSFNDTVGERTPEKGYQPAGAYVAGETVDQVGGGICQVASTLYYCSLYADLEILERYEHMFSVDYVPLGLDATINWGTLDYRFRNNTDHPIRIEANADDGYVTIRLMGTDDKDYYVAMEYEVLETLEWEEVEKILPPDNEDGYKDGDYIEKYPFDGYIVDTYKCKYSKETDELISREYETHSEYDKRDRVICRIPEQATEPSTQPEDPTEPPTEAPAEP